ncbi:MAG: NmrA family NAD(P)-binding protein [Polyangiales bacterium]
MYVIAGASGRTGKKVAETLLAQGQRVRVLVRGDADAWRARGAEAVVVALEDGQALREAVAGARGLYALIPDQAPDRAAIVDAMVVAARAVPHVVLLSALPAARASGNGPCAVLHEAERRLREVTALCALRPCTFQETVSARDGTYLHFFGAAPVPLVATRDVAAAAVHCLREPRTEIVDLIGPSYTGAELAEALGARLIEVPAHARLNVLMQAMPAPMAHAVAELYACLGSVSPAGDRLIAGSTSFVQTLCEGRT